VKSRGRSLGGAARLSGIVGSGIDRTNVRVMVTLTFVGWNLISGWLHTLAGLRCAA